MASAASVGEWPSLVRSIFLTQNKNTAGIFAVRVFLRGKPYVISLDDNLMFSTSGNPVYAKLSDDGTSTWGAIIEKAWAKVLGNYLKTNAGYIHNGLRFLTGNPIFFYGLSNTTVLSTTFTLINAADQANYILAAGTGAGTDTTYNVCGIPNGHAYSILAAFNMTDAAGKVHSVYLFRNPWGVDYYYNQTWSATDPNWTNALVAQIPLGVDPRSLQRPDGVFVVQMESFYKCFDSYYIGHIRDS
jgi:hypothetical protein